MAERASPALIDVLKRARENLSEAGIDSAPLDARLIVEHLSGTTRTDAVTTPHLRVEARVRAAIDAAVARRVAGEPVHRILGMRDFYGLPLKLSRATLEPRPDTETLVDAVLPFVRRTAGEKGGCRVLDLGTGTGAVALALLSEEANATATGTDISEEALATAADNADALGLKGRFVIAVADWFAGLEGTWDAIVSNPPYIVRDVIAGLAREVRDHDPHLALDGGHDGLDAYRAIAEGARTHLEPAGLLALEIGFDQKGPVSALLSRHGFTEFECFRDLGGRDRVLAAKRPA